MQLLGKILQQNQGKRLRAVIFGPFGQPSEVLSTRGKCSHVLVHIMRKELNKEKVRKKVK